MYDNLITEYKSAINQLTEEQLVNWYAKIEANKKFVDFYTSELKKFPHLPMICPSIRPTQQVSANKGNEIFFIFAYIIPVKAPPMIPP